MGSKGIRDRVCIVGMGCIPFGEHWDLSTEDMLLDAAGATLASAGVTLDDIDAYWLGTAASGVSGLTLSRALRIGDKPVTRLENMCATGSEAVSIRRNVISTRSPMATAAGSTSVSWQRKRPPSAKSMTAATIGGFGVNARRSTVKVAT